MSTITDAMTLKDAFILILGDLKKTDPASNSAKVVLTKQLSAGTLEDKDVKSWIELLKGTLTKVNKITVVGLKGSDELCSQFKTRLLNACSSVDPKRAIKLEYVDA